MINERMQPQPTALMMAVGQPNVKASYASPQFTPSGQSNIRSGYHQQQQHQLIVGPAAQVVSQWNGGGHNGGREVFSMGPPIGGTRGQNNGQNRSEERSSGVTPAVAVGTDSNYIKAMNAQAIQGRRIDSPELKVAVNRDIPQHSRPQTAGNPPPFLQHLFGQQSTNKQDYLTIANSSQYPSGNNTLNMNLSKFTGSQKRGAGTNAKPLDVSNIHRGSATIQYDDDLIAPNVKQSNRQQKGKSQHNPQKRRKQQKQHSKSAPKYNSVPGGNSIPQATMINNQAAQSPLININIQNAKIQKPQPAPLRNRAEQRVVSQVAPPQSASVAMSKSRSRSQQRNKGPGTVPKEQNVKLGNQQQFLKAGPHHSKNVTSKIQIESIAPSTGVDGIIPPFSFDNKENQSASCLDEEHPQFSPARVIAHAIAQAEATNISKSGNTKKRTGKSGSTAENHHHIANFLDSDSSLSSPKPHIINGLRPPHADSNSVINSSMIGGQSQSGVNKSQYYMDKSSFLRHFSPERQPIAKVASGQLGNSERQLSGHGQKNNTSGNRINMKVIDNMMLKEKFKLSKQGEECVDEMARRKHLDDQIQRQINRIGSKAANDLNSQRQGVSSGDPQKKQQQPPVPRLNISSSKHSKLPSQQFHHLRPPLGGVAHPNQISSATTKLDNYKKQRSKSCMNKSDNPISSQTAALLLNHPVSRSKERPAVVCNGPPQQPHHSDVVVAPSPPGAQVNVQNKKNQQRIVEKRPPRNEKGNSLVLEMKELKKLCLEELKKELLAGKIGEGTSGHNSAGFASNKRQANIVNVSGGAGIKKDSKNNVSQHSNSHTNQQSKGDLNTIVSQPGAPVLAKEKIHVKNQNGNTSSQNSIIMLNPVGITTKIKQFIQNKKKQQGYIPKSLEQTIINEKRKSGNNQLGMLFKKMKTKQPSSGQSTMHPSHLRHQSYNFLLKKQQALTSLEKSTDNNTSSQTCAPLRRLKPQFYNSNKPTQNKKGAKQNVFNYHLNAEQLLMEHPDLQSLDGAGGVLPDSNSLTPVRSVGDGRLVSASGSRGKNNNDISLEFQEDYQRLVSQIQFRHNLRHEKGKTNGICNSNPPVQNRRKGHHDPSNDSITLDISNSGNKKRDLSWKQEQSRKKVIQKASKPQKNKSLLDELEQRVKGQRKQQLQRTLVHNNEQGVSIESSPQLQNQRSSSSPKTIPTSGMIFNVGNNTSTLNPPHSDITTLAIDKQQYYLSGPGVNAASSKKSIIDNVEGISVSNQAFEQREKVVRTFTKEYGPHIHRLRQLQNGGRAVRVTKTQLLVTLTSAAIVIQSQIRKYLQRRGFYEASGRYIDSEQDEDYDNMPTEQKRPPHPPTSLIAQMSPLRVKPKSLKQNLLKQNADTNQFYAPNTIIQEKVVVCSVIASPKPELVGGYSQQESLQNSQNPTQYYAALRHKPQLEHVQEVVTIPSGPTSGFNTAIKQNVEQQLKTNDQASKSQSPDYIDTSSKQLLKEESPAKEAGQQDLSSRKNLVPQLNLASLKSSQQASKVQLSASLTEHSKHSLENLTHQRNGGGMFDRHSFQEFQEHHHFQDFKLEQYPQMVQLREEAIKQKETTEKQLLKQMQKSNQLSPRTYEKRRRDLEIWVTKEREEVKKTKKVYEEEWHKTQSIIAQTQKDQETMKKLMGDQVLPHSSTHRSKHIDGVNNQFEDALQSSRVNRDSQRQMHSSRPDNKSYLDSLINNRNDVDNRHDPYQHMPQQHVDTQSRQTLSKQSNFDNNLSVETPPDLFVNNDQNQIPKIVVSHIPQQPVINKLLLDTSPIEAIIDSGLKVPQHHLQDGDDVKAFNKLEEEQKHQQVNKQHQFDTQLVNDSLMNEELANFEPFGGNRIDNLMVDSSSDYEQAAEHQNDSGGHKVLQRTRGSIQLHNPNDEEDEEQEPDEIDPINKLNNFNNREQSGVEEDPLNSDFRRNIHDDSVDHEHPLGQEGDECLDNLLKSHSPNVQEQIMKENFFIDNFDLGTPQTILDQISRPRQSPTAQDNSVSHVNEYESSKHLNAESKDDYTKGSKPAPPSSPCIVDVPTNDHTVINNSKVLELDEIDLNLAPLSPGQLSSNPPVSPLSNQDSVNSGGGMGANGAQGGIIIGGGSLNSTLSAGENGAGNLDLQRVIHDVRYDLEKTAIENDLPSDNEKLAEVITDELYQRMMEELKFDMEFLLVNDNRFKNIESQASAAQNPPSRFPIFDRRGIQTDLFAIERYVEEVLQEVLLDKDRFMSNIMEPISRNSQEVLNQLQNSEIGSYEHFEQHFPQVLPLDTYLKLERRRKDLRNASIDSSNSNSDSRVVQALEARNFLAECEHIHNKVLFDCINDSLLQFKPYSKDGEPLPWSRQNRKLKPIEDFTVEEMFEIVKHDLFRWAIMQAGTLPRREFVFGGHFDEELFAEIREKKLATLLAREMIENEPRWLNYEFEEAQVKIDIGDMILEQLVTETITILNERMGGPAATASITDITSTFTSRVLL